MKTSHRTVFTTSSAVAAALMASIGLASPAMAAEAAVAADEAAADLEPGEIIVTARKKAEDILKTPLTVSALTSKDIAVRGIVSINDLAANTPGFNVSNTNSGRNDRSFQLVVVRGFTPSSGTNNTTSMFIDGVPVNSTTALNSIDDPERVEILKGPQSAYFGRNTFAGAINVVNKLPGDTFAGSVTASGGTRANYNIHGDIEGPVVGDLLTFRLSARKYSKNGSYDNGSDPDQTLGDQSTYGGNLMIVAKPTERLTIKAFGLYSRDKDGPSAQGMLSAYEVRSNNGVSNIPALSGNSNGTIVIPNSSNCVLRGFATGISTSEARVSRPFLCGKLPGLPAGFSPAQNTAVDTSVANFLANPTGRLVSPGKGVQGYGLVREYYHTHLNIDYELGDTGVTLSSLTGYNNEYFSELADLDNYNSRSFNNTLSPAASVGARTFWDFPFLIERKNHDFSQEVRAAYDRGPIRAVVGASYLNAFSQGDGGGGNGIGNATTLSSVSGGNRSKTIGGFFGLGYKITDALTINLEGRYQVDELIAYAGPLGNTVISGALGVPAGFYPGNSKLLSKKYKNFLPRIIAQYDVVPDVMVYASYSKGVNPGIFNAASLSRDARYQMAFLALGLKLAVEPEKLTNYEIGVKGKLFDNMLRFALSAYYGDWTNQINSRSAFYLDQNNTNQIASGSINTGKVRVKGIELDTTLTPAEGFNINFSASYNDTALKAYSDPATSKLTGVIGDGYVGNSLANAPKFTSALGVQYGSGIRGIEDGTWFIRGDAIYRSKLYSDAANLNWTGARKPVNFRAGIAKGPMSLEAFVTNAFNDRNFVSATTNTVLDPSFAISGTNSYVNVGLPDLRTFGLKVGYRF